MEYMKECCSVTVYKILFQAPFDYAQGDCKTERSRSLVFLIKNIVI